jgi:membrane-associated phospholipid phosphatase
VSTARLAITALISLAATAVLAVIVAHGTSPYGFEDPVIDLLGRRSAIRSWGNVADLLGTPTIVVVFIACLGFGLYRQAVLRVSLYAVLAVVTILISDHVAKPLVHRTYYGELTFPSGHVTAASATAFAMWLALFPLLGKRDRVITLLAGVAWVLLMSVAVIRALWHTPLDVAGAVLLSVGIISAGGALLESNLFRGTGVSGRGGSETGNQRVRSGPGVEELLGQTQDPVGVAQAQGINQEKG